MMIKAQSGTTELIQFKNVNDLVTKEEKYRKTPG